MFEEIKSTTQTFFDRIKNPFIGTFILCSLIINWELIYMIFNFDHDCTLNDKLADIHNYILRVGGYTIFENIYHFIIHPSLYALSLFIFYQIGKLLFVIILQFYNDRLEPFILSVFDKTIWVKREDKNNLEMKFDALSDSYNSLRQDYRIKISDVSDIETENRRLLAELKAKTDALIDFNELKDTLYDYKKDEQSSKNYLLGELFRGEFVCKWHTPTGNKGRETFLISDNLYIMNGNAYASIKNIRYYQQKKLLIFEKHFSDNREPGYNYLIQLSPNHYIGSEDTHIKGIIIEYFSINNTKSESIAIAT